MNNIMEKEQREVQNELFSEVQTEKLENDLLQMNDLSEINISLDSEIENVIHEMNQLKLSYSNIQTQNLVDLCKDSVLSTIVGQFGLASLFIESQDGGNVTTIHNARKDIYSSDKDKYDRKVYEKGEYIPGKNGEKGTWSGNSNGEKFSGGENSVGSKFTKSQMDKNGNVVEGLTGRIQQASTTSPDHNYALKKYHQEGGFMQSAQEKCDFATDTDNLTCVDRSINYSLADMDKEEWQEAVQGGRDITNKEYFGTKDELIKESKRKGEIVAQKHLPTNMEKARYYFTNVAKTGGKDAAKMAAYSAIGVIIHDFSLAVIEEIKFIISNKGTESFSELFNHFKSRMANVMSELKNKWKEIFIGSFEQGIVAFLSNILIFVINLFATTLKKLVAMIRAGFVSVCQAVKIMINKLNNITQEEVNYEAVKVLTTGMIGALSIGLSAAIEKFLQSIVCLQPLMMFPIPSFGREQRTVSDVIAVTLSSLAGGIVSTIVVYFMDTINNNIKKDKIQIQLLTQSQILVSMETMKSWLCLNNAYNYFTESITQATEKINLLNTQMNNFSMQMNVAAAETEDAMEKLRNFTKSLGE